MPRNERAPHQGGGRGVRSILEDPPPTQTAETVIPDVARPTAGIITIPATVPTRASGTGANALLTASRPSLVAASREVAMSSAGRYYTDAQLQEYREWFHNRRRLTMDKPVLLYQTPILDNRPYVQPFCYAPLLFPCCMKNEYRQAYCGKRDNGDSLSSTARRSGNLAVAESEVNEVGYVMSMTRGGDGVTQLDELDEVMIPMRAPRGGNPAFGETANPLLSPGSTGSEDAPRTGGGGRVLGESLDGYTTSTGQAGDLEGDEERQLRNYRGLRAGRGGHAGHRPRTCSNADGGVGRPRHMDGCHHLLYRCFCLRCTIAQQTDLLFREEERRQRVPYRFCAEWFFGREGNYTRSLVTMLLCDLLTGGLFIPCGFSYQGLGTACFGWRARYLIRCRYNIYTPAIADLGLMLVLPLQAVDQQGMEMAAHGLFEVPAVCYASQMR